MGLEFLDVTAQIGVAQARSHGDGENGRQRDAVQFTNISPAVVDTHLIVVVQGLDSHTSLLNASGITHGGDPYLRVFLPHGVLRPGGSIVRRLDFSGPHAAQARYTLKLLSGQGNP